jgi:uncharacterized RDD family membrane protein YckC
MEVTPRYAGFWVRVFAFWLDCLVLGAIFGLIGWLLGVSKWDEAHPQAMLILMWLYFAGMESSRWQATLGKKALDIRVTDLEGNRISFLRAAARNLAKYFSLVILFVGVLMIPFTKRKQGLHDLIARCLVVWG